MFWIIWLLMLLVLLISFGFHSMFLNQLKAHHPVMYSDLGNPTTFTKYPLISALIVRDLSANKSLTKYSEFMAKKHWLSLNDNQLNKYSNLRLISLYLAVGLFIFGFFGNKI